MTDKMWKESFKKRAHSWSNLQDAQDSAHPREEGGDDTQKRIRVTTPDYENPGNWNQNSPQIGFHTIPESVRMPTSQEQSSSHCCSTTCHHLALHAPLKTSSPNETFAESHLASPNALSFSTCRSRSPQSDSLPPLSDPNLSFFNIWGPYTAHNAMLRECHFLRLHRAQSSNPSR